MRDLDARAEELGENGDSIFNPTLPFIKSGEIGNRVRNGRFLNPYTIESAPFLDVLRWKLTPNEQGREKRLDTFALAEQSSRAFLDSNEDALVWLGHATFLIRLSGVTFLTDPCFFDMPFVKRLAGFPVILDSLETLDYLLVSHGHFDHFDSDSVRHTLKLHPELEALLPLRMGELYRDATQGSRFQTAAWYQRYDTNESVEVVFLPSFHWHRRSLLDFNRILWGSFLIRANGKSIYFAGDTAFSPHFEEIFSTVGSVDICILPIGAYKPRYLMKDSHINPAEAVLAARKLRAGLAIPMHFGTYDLADEPLGEPIHRFKDAAEGSGLDVNPLDLGEVFWI